MILLVAFLALLFFVFLIEDETPRELRRSFAKLSFEIGVARCAQAALSENTSCPDVSDIPFAQRARVAPALRTKSPRSLTSYTGFQCGGFLLSGASRSSRIDPGPSFAGASPVSCALAAPFARTRPLIFR